MLYLLWHFSQITWLRQSNYANYDWLAIPVNCFLKWSYSND